MWFNRMSRKENKQAAAHRTYLTSELQCICQQKVSLKLLAGQLDIEVPLLFEMEAAVQHISEDLQCCLEDVREKT